MGYIPAAFPPMPKPDPIMEELRGMLSLSKTDEGMKDLLDQARMYYALKKPVVTMSPEASAYYAPYIPVTKILFDPIVKKPHPLRRLWNKITSNKK